MSSFWTFRFVSQISVGKTLALVYPFQWDIFKKAQLECISHLLPLCYLVINMNLPVSDMLICDGLPHELSPCIHVCTCMCLNQNGLSAWGHAFSKGECVTHMTIQEIQEKIKVLW